MKLKVVSTGFMLTLLLIGMLTFAFGTNSISATVDIVPSTLNLKSKGNWIVCRIDLPEGYNASDVDRTTVMLNGSIPVDPFWVGMPEDARARDDDGVSIFWVKFNRTAVREFIVAQGITYGDVTFTITGEVNGELFEGSDTIRSRMPGDVDSNGVVDIADVVTVAAALGLTDPYTDLNEDEDTDVYDIAIVATNFGKTY